MADPLDLHLTAVFNDRPLLARVVRAIELDQGVDFVTALDRLHNAADHAWAAHQPTLRTALAFGDSDYMAGTLRLLDRRDEAVTAAAERSMRKLDQDVDQLGRVKLSAAKAAKILAGDPVMFQKRLARARTANRGSFGGDQGAEHFRALDQEYAHAGLDVVKTLERPSQVAAAQAHPAGLAKQLDAAISAAGDKRQKLKLLEQQVAELDTAAGATFDSARSKVDQLADDTLQAPLRMLDQLTSESGKKAKKKLTATEPEGDAPPGVHPGSYALDQRVRARMTELDAPASDYTRILDQILTEDTPR